MAETIIARVRRGAKLLDKTLPGWEKKIRLHDLDLNNCEVCILGQLYRSYFKGLDALFDGDLAYKARYLYGFSSLRKDKLMKRLTRTWGRFILGRLALLFRG